MRAVLKTAFLWLLIGYVADNVGAAIFHRQPAYIHTIVGPAIEELTRYYVAGRSCWTAGPGKAVLIGLLMGVREIGTKTFEGYLTNFDGFELRWSLVLCAVSIPTYTALSLAFYAIWNGRWWKMIVLPQLLEHPWLPPLARRNASNNTRSVCDRSIYDHDRRKFGDRFARGVTGEGSRTENCS